jgi:transcription-repair coupling factor (superfamily II helicase)
VQKSICTELLERVAASEPLSHKLRTIQRARWPVRFSHVVQPAQPFLAAIIACVWHRLPADDRQAADSTIWILCPSVHSQEVFYESFVNWQPDALFLPEAEFGAAENVLPDPEITAERLAVLMQIGSGKGPHVIVATQASLDQAAPEYALLKSALIQLRRGASAQMEQFLEKLTAGGYERAAQVTTRGQFAVRGGIVDLYSWQAPLPVRLEFFGDQLESLREFDIDTQTSVRDLDSLDILLGAATAPNHKSLIDDQSGHVRDYVGGNHLGIEIEPEETSNTQIQISEGWIETGSEDFSGAFQDCEIGEFAVGDLVLAEAKRAQFAERLKEWRANNTKIVIYFQTEGEIERFREIMGGATEAIDFVEGTLARGFCFTAANLVVLSAADLRRIRAGACVARNAIERRSTSVN